MAGLRISQKTFDAAVAENVEEFEMSPEEALADAIEQFKSQGVDLSNLDTSGASKPGDETVHPVAEASRALKAVVEKAATEPDAVVEQLRNLISLCAGNTEHREVAGNEDAVEASIQVTEVWAGDKGHWGVLPVAFDTVRCLVTKHDINRMRLTAGFFTTILNTIHAPKETDVDYAVHRAALAAAASACVRREKFKLTLMKGDFPAAVAATLRDHGERPAVLREAMAAIRALTTDDDKAAVMSKTFSSAREFAGAGVIPLVFQHLRVQSDDTAFVMDAFGVLTKLSCDDNICQDITAEGLEQLVAIVAKHMPHTGVTKAGMALLRALARSDKNKKLFCTGETPPMRLMLEALALHKDSAPVLEQALGAAASTCLRHPEHSVVFVEAGSLPVIAQAMRLHSGHTGIQRQACQAVRNFVARSPELRPAVVDEGFEPLIRAARAAHPRAEDVAYAALRDMGVDDYVDTEEAVLATAGAGAGERK